MYSLHYICKFHLPSRENFTHLTPQRRRRYTVISILRNGMQDQIISDAFHFFAALSAPNFVFQTSQIFIELINLKL